MKKTTYQVMILTMLIVLLSIGVNAFGISMRYIQDRTLVLYPGESLDFELGLQNPGGDQDDLIKVEVIGGSEIARIVDEENVYKIPKGADDARVHVKIDVPSNASLGTEWNVQFRASLTSEREGGGMVQFKMSVADGFKVRAGPEPKPESLAKEKSAVSAAWLIGGVILIILIALSLIYYRRKKR